METVSRRSVMGIAASVLAGGVLAGEGASTGSTPAEEQRPESNEPASAKTESL